MLRAPPPRRLPTAPLRKKLVMPPACKDLSYSDLFLGHIFRIKIAKFKSLKIANPTGWEDCCGTTITDYTGFDDVRETKLVNLDEEGP